MARHRHHNSIWNTIKVGFLAGFIGLVGVTIGGAVVFFNYTSVKSIANECVKDPAACFHLNH